MSENAAPERVARVAMIGAGNMANAVHYPSLRDIENAHIVAVCDLDEERLHTTADRYQVQATYTDYHKMLDDVDAEAVYVVMRPDLLFHIVIDCIRARRHVFTEKPPGITTNQTRCMAREAEKHDVLSMVAFNRRFMPVLVEARQRVEARGPIEQCKATLIKQPGGFPEERGGACGPLCYDGIHALDMLRWLGGEVSSLSSVVRSLGQPHANSFLAVARFEGGAAGLLNVNWHGGARRVTFEMHAAGISAYVDGNTKDPVAAIYADGAGEPVEVIDGIEAAGSDEYYKFYGFFGENQHFIDCVLSGKQPQTNFADALKSMELHDRVMLNAL